MVFSINMPALRPMRALLKVMTGIILFLQVSASPRIASAGNPHTEWHKLETEHFEIIFDSRHYQLAKDFARHAETAWQTLVPVFRTWPDKTRVVIDDSGDQANGMATGFPFPQIHLYPATPAPGETIGDTGPWGLELVTHEYAHVLNFQPAHGVFHFLRTIFGEIVRPNVLLPRWYLEGLAVEMETRFSPSGGRLRSPDFMAIPRAMVQDDILRREDVSRIGVTEIPDWPGGTRPYLFGGLVWEKLTRENLSIVGDLNDAYAKRLPFLIDTPLRDRTGQDWQGFLDSVYTEIEAKSVDQIEQLCERGCLEGTKFGEDSFYSRSPVLSRNTTGLTALAFITREHNHDSVLTIVDRKADGSFDYSNVIRADEPSNAMRVSWLPDATAVVYDGIDSAGRYEERSDLWLYDRAKKRVSRLSTGLRAREPDVNLDGNQIAFVQLTPGRTQLAIASLTRDGDAKPKLGPSVTLYAPTDDNRVAWPTFISKNILAFVERSADGKEVLKVLELRDTNTSSAAAPRTVTMVGNATFPRLVKTATSSQLIFASNRTGITNLYIADIKGATARDFSLDKIRPLTNSVTRAWTGDLDPTSMNLVYTRLDGDGSRIRVLTATDRAQNQTVVEGELLTLPLLIERKDAKYVPPTVNLPASSLEAHDFNVWPYLIPRYWMPYAGFVPGGAFISASTSAGDPMGRHSIAASISTDTRIGKPNFFAAYANYTSDIRYVVSFDDFWQRFSSSGLDRHSTTADASGTFYIPSFSNSWRGEVGISHQRDEIPSTTTGTDVRIKGGPRVGLIWQDLSQRGYEVSPEKGGSMRIAHARYLPELGNLVYDKTDLSMVAYLSRARYQSLLGWFPERHSLSASLNVSWLPGLDRLLLSPSSVSLPIETIALGSASTSFVMRGYPSGSFLGRKLLRGSLEYRLPLTKSYHGFGTWPAFIRRWHAALFADAVTVEGAIYDFNLGGYRGTNIGNMYSSVGVEARLDSTLFYHLPVQFIFGVHYGFDKRVNPNGAYPIFSIAL